MIQDSLHIMTTQIHQHSEWYKMLTVFTHVRLEFISSELVSQFVGVHIFLSLEIICLSLQVWREAVQQNVA